MTILLKGRIPLVAGASHRHYLNQLASHRGKLLQSGCAFAYKWLLDDALHMTLLQLARETRDDELTRESQFFLANLATHDRKAERRTRHTVYAARAVLMLVVDVIRACENGTGTRVNVECAMKRLNG